MGKVLLYSVLLVGGLVASQFLAGAGETAIRLATMFFLAFIMIHVGFEFEIDKARPRQYAWDYVVAATAAAFPWILCALYFVEVLGVQSWTEALLLGRFASPTSAGVLFAMLAAAGLSSTWVFRKARVLAIFDDLDTILLMIPLKMMLVGMKWQLAGIVVIIGAQLWLAWRYLHVLRLPVGWPWVLLYAGVLTGACEAVHVLSIMVDDTVPVHLEVLLPAFVLGCMLARPAGHDAHAVEAGAGGPTGPGDAAEQRVATVVSACFMVLVGLSMPAIPRGGAGWGVIAGHVLLITLLSNLGKMFPALCYRREAGVGERLALAVAMFPRGEVGAGVLVISLSYGVGGIALTVSVLSLALNLLLTGPFIVAVKALIGPGDRAGGVAAVEAAAAGPNRSRS